MNPANEIHNGKASADAFRFTTHSFERGALFRAARHSGFDHAIQNS
jgi:hypothetical protein